MALVIAGERSGAGKTTVTLALLASLRRSGHSVQSFKVGPDYIDPMFHQFITGRTCRNLDPVLTSEAYVKRCFAQHSQIADYSVIEGVMGLFDGATGSHDRASTAHIARLLELPVLLVLDCSRLSRSIAAIAHGFRSFDPRVKLAGVILNRVGSNRHLELLQDALEPLNLPILGILRRQDDITIPDRHLGLIPTAELPNLGVVMEQLAHVGQRCFDWSQLLPLLQKPTSVPDSLTTLPAPIAAGKTPVRIAIARDRAFSFYYPDNLEILEALGAELVFWSPLLDPQLPEGIQGLYLGGGFPEVFAPELAANQPALDAVRMAVQAGLPTYAECGGLMYLCQQITDLDGHTWPMAGLLPTNAIMGDRLTLGYRQVMALQDSPLLTQGATVYGHEFHRSHLSGLSTSPLYEIRPYDGRPPAAKEGWLAHQLHASYIHLHFGDRPDLPARFLHHCVEFEHRCKT